MENIKKTVLKICFPLSKFSSIFNSKIKIFLDNKLGIIFGRKLNFHTDSLKVCQKFRKSSKIFWNWRYKNVELYEYKNEEEPSNFIFQ